MLNENTYTENIKPLKKISSTEGDKLLSTEKLAIIYIGRESCPYCRKFSTTINSLSDQISTTIYYIDSSNSADDNLDSFRQKHNIVTVPGFIVAKDGSISVRCDSSTSVSELLDMIN